MTGFEKLIQLEATETAVNTSSMSIVDNPIIGIIGLVFFVFLLFGIMRWGQ